MHLPPIRLQIVTVTLLITLNLIWMAPVILVSRCNTSLTFLARNAGWDYDNVANTTNEWLLSLWFS